MVWVSLCRIGNVRNIESGEFQPGRGINLFWGGNGAGKTSVLESVYLVAYGRSFRTRRVAEVRRRGASQVGVYVEKRGDGVDGEAEGIAYKVASGIRVISVNGRPVERQRGVAERMPVGVFTPGRLGLVWGAAEERRAYLDWMLFHVKQDYADKVQAYRHALRQRNAALRSPGGSRGLGPWDKELAERGEAVVRLQSRVVAALAGALESEPGLVGSGLGLSLRYRKGFSPDRSLLDALRESADKDRVRGWTGVGPHVADVQILDSEGREARRVLSRGQGKSLALSLLAAGAEYINGHSGRAPVLLVDDYDAELDADGVDRALGRFRSLGCQVFLTGLRKTGVSSSGEDRVFHVKQGLIE